MMRGCPGRPPSGAGSRSCSLRTLALGENIMFMAIAAALVAIAIISATRDILTAGAELSQAGHRLPLAATMIELGVRPGVVVALSVALVLVRRFARRDRA
jgi:hypothetical protein